MDELDEETSWSETIHASATQFLLDENDREAADILLSCSLELTGFKHDRFNQKSYYDAYLRGPRTIYEIINDSDNKINERIVRAFNETLPSASRVSRLIYKPPIIIPAVNWKEQMLKSRIVTEGNVKNLIFAANGPKPEIILTDAITNNIKIVKNEEYCLIYDQPILKRGLLWKDLEDWWYPRKQSKNLIDRLFESIESKPERDLFQTYVYNLSSGEMPALIPQVYLHYDPYAVKQLAHKNLLRQRMDFLMLLPNDVRIVLEVDGKQHYSSPDKAGNYVANTKLYAEMVSEDRKLKLAGYEIYRFGGREFEETDSEDLIISFFQRLFHAYGISVVADVLFGL